MLMKMFNMHKTQKEEKKKDEEDEDEDDSTDEEETNAAGAGKQPKLHQTAIKHNGCVNRIKVILQDQTVLLFIFVLFYLCLFSFLFIHHFF